MIESEEGLAFAGEAADGVAAVAAVRHERPDIVLMDIRMPGFDGLEATRRITTDPDLEQTRIIVLTTFELDEYVFDALRYGASGFLLKDTAPAELVQAIKLVADGGALLSPSVTRRVIREFASRSTRSWKPHPRLDTLTDREREIVGLVGQGLNNDEIAARLVVSPATARSHVGRAMSRSAPATAHSSSCSPTSRASPAEVRTKFAALKHVPASSQDFVLGSRVTAAVRPSASGLGRTASDQDPGRILSGTPVRESITPNTGTPRGANVHLSFRPPVSGSSTTATSSLRGTTDRFAAQAAPAVPNRVAPARTEAMMVRHAFLLM